MTPRELANQLSAICHAGFDNEHHWAAWLKKHQPEIDRLPVPLKRQVMLAYDNASAVEFSRPAKARR